MPWKTGWGRGGGGSGTSNFPTRDHQNIFNFIRIWIFKIKIVFFFLGGGELFVGGTGPLGLYGRYGYDIYEPTSLTNFE